MHSWFFSVGAIEHWVRYLPLSRFPGYPVARDDYGYPQSVVELYIVDPNVDQPSCIQTQSDASQTSEDSDNAAIILGIIFSVLGFCIISIFM